MLRTKSPMANRSHYLLLLCAASALFLVGCGDGKDTAPVCTILGTSVILNPDTVDVAPADSALVAVYPALLDNDHCGDLAVWFRVALAEPASHPITVTGCDSVPMYDNSGIGRLQVHAPAGTPETAYTVYLETVMYSQSPGLFWPTTSSLTVNVTSLTNFSVSVSPSTVSIPQGESDQVTVKVTRTGGHSLPVSLTLEGPFVGTEVEGTFDPDTVAGADSTSQLTIAVGGFVTPGSYWLTVRGDDGVRQKTFPVLNLTVTPSVSDFSISLSRSNVRIMQGESDTLTVFVVRTGGHNAPVTLSLFGLPSDVGVSYNPLVVPGSGSSSILTLSVDPYASLNAGTPVMVTGTAGGSQRSAYFQLTIAEFESPWKRQQTGGVVSWLNSVDFTDASHGVAVGEAGSIIRTTNGGITPWTKLDAGTTEMLYGVQFLSSMTGYVVGSNSTFLKTVNGGSSWADTLGPEGISSDFNGLYFSSASRGWVVGSVICYTEDGGQNWVTQLDSEWGRTWHGVAFGSAANGVVVGYKSGVGRQIRYTLDAGASWLEGTFPAGNQQVRSVCFAGASTFYAGAEDEMLKSMDGGVTWTELATSFADVVNGVAFYDANNGWVVGSTGVHRTSDGGSNWVTEYNEPGENLNGVCVVDSRTAFAVGFLAASGIVIRRN